MSTPVPWSITVVAGATADSDPSFLVTFPNAKYLFNVPESTTRTFIQRKLHLNKLKALFLPRVHSDTSLGIPGMLLSMPEGQGPIPLSLRGPPGLIHYLASMRLYVRRVDLELTPSEVSVNRTQLCHQDENIKVFSIPIKPRKPAAISNTRSPTKRVRSSSPSESSSHEITTIDKLHMAFSGSPKRGTGLKNQQESVVESMFSKGAVPVAGKHMPIEESVGLDDTHQAAYYNPTHLLRRLPSYTSDGTVCVFLGLGPAMRGKFDAKKADALGVPKGRDRGRLTKGESVTALDGSIVTPEMCLGPGEPPMAFLVVDCPNSEYIPELVETSDIVDTLKDHSAKLHIVLHRTGDGVLENPEYVQWMHSFGPSVHHVIANRSYNKDQLTFASSAALQLQLSALDDSMFRVPTIRHQTIKNLHDVPNLPERVHLASPTVFMMKQNSNPEPMMLEDDFDPTLYKNVDSGLPEPVQKSFRETVNSMKSLVDSRQAAKDDDVIAITLGTGSAIPGKYRNVSSSMIQFPGSGYLLLDAGEGTWGQISRHFGPDEALEVLRNIRCIFISHLHADHHIGITKILAKRRQLEPRPEPVYLIGNGGTIIFLQEYNEIDDLGINDPDLVRFITAEHLDPNNEAAARNKSYHRIQSLNHLEELKKAMGLTKVESVRVIHRAFRCHGIVIEHKDFGAIVYSGDSEPCEELVKAGQGASLLIHEATMADDQEALAKHKTHSTMAQAIDVGRRMNAKKVLLNHFSGRYPKFPKGLTKHYDIGDTMEIGVAFDHLHLRLGDLWKMERYAPVLEAFLVEEEEGEVADDLV